MHDINFAFASAYAFAFVFAYTSTYIYALTIVIYHRLQECVCVCALTRSLIRALISTFLQTSRLKILIIIESFRAPRFIAHLKK